MPKNVIPVFSGAGVNGGAHVGAILLLQKLLGGSLSSIQHTGGSSSGAIVAMLLALNCSAEKIHELFQTIDFAKINDGCEVIDLVTQESLYKGKALRECIENLLITIHGNTKLTFRELEKKGYKNLKVMTTILGEQADGNGMTLEKEFSAEKTPDTEVFLAVLASCSIPGLFPAIRLKEIDPGHFVEDKQGFQFYDGGFVLDLPEKLFDKKKYVNSIPKESQTNIYCYNPDVIGFLLTSPQEISHTNTLKPIPPHHPIRTLTALANGAIKGSQQRDYAMSLNPERTILLSDLNNAATNFKVSDEVKSETEAAAMGNRVEMALREMLQEKSASTSEEKSTRAKDFAKKRVQFSKPVYTSLTHVLSTDPSTTPTPSSPTGDCKGCVIS